VELPIRVAPIAHQCRDRVTTFVGDHAGVKYGLDKPLDGRLLQSKIEAGEIIRILMQIDLLGSKELNCRLLCKFADIGHVPDS
jgi:hypothetical protein